MIIILWSQITDNWTVCLTACSCWQHACFFFQINCPSLKFLNLQVSIPNYFSVLWSWQKCYWSRASGCSITVHPWTKRKYQSSTLLAHCVQHPVDSSYFWIPITKASNAERVSMLCCRHGCVYSVQRRSALLMTCKLILIGINSVIVMAWDDQHSKCITLMKWI